MAKKKDDRGDRKPPGPANDDQPAKQDGGFTPEERERWEYSEKYPAFKGDLDCDIKLEILGLQLTRRFRVQFEHTPEWEYWDLNKGAPYEGWAFTSTHFQVEAVPEDWTGETADDAKLIYLAPVWTSIGELAQDGVLNDDMWNAIYDRIDEHCKGLDAERRRDAGA